MTGGGQEKINNKEILRKVAPNLVRSFVILILLWLIKPALVGLLVIIVGVFVAFTLYNYFKKKEFNLKAFLRSLITTSLFVVVIYFYFKFSYGYVGNWSAVIFLILISAYVLWVVRKEYVKYKRLMEAMIFGKPLREFTKEELRNRKIKFVWKKKNKGA